MVLVMDVLHFAVVFVVVVSVECTVDHCFYAR